MFSSLVERIAQDWASDARYRNLRADHVETMFYRANEYRQYVEMPRAIVRFDTLDLPADHGSQFWIYCTA
ncbi:MAG: hypothetical protein IIB19_02580, partial [Chloroflexi bacterium]|nr:hypothetical protein [Chloroflexota bacterium]